VPRQEAIAGFAALLSGRYDDLPEEAFLMCGTLQDAVGRASRDNDHAGGSLDRI
jgi:F-type H+-transporting ATPase subunit beta